MKTDSKSKIFSVLVSVISIGAVMIILVSLYNFIHYIPLAGKASLKPDEIQSNNWFNFWTSAGLQFLIAGAAFMSGSFMGFVFGIPKYNKNIETEKKTGAIAFSDNLVQVSDWLTKIIVGVGLTQLTKIPGYLESLGTYIHHTSPTVNANIAIAIIIYFVICGFAGGYLWTTIYYPEIMNNVYKAVTDERIDEIKKESDERDEAIRIVNEQMAKGVGQSDLPVASLEEAIGKLNEKSKDAIFQLVDRVCYENAETNKRIVKRTIPIFQALINAGNAEQVFEYYAELGFAYMSLGNYTDAYTALVSAYDKRPAGKGNHEHIEHNLAECLIRNNTNADGTYSVNDETKSQILNYLKLAIKNPRLEEHMREETPDNLAIPNWLKSINMDLNALKQQA